jgi:hypothetical protein
VVFGRTSGSAQGPTAGQSFAVSVTFLVSVSGGSGNHSITYSKVSGYGSLFGSGVNTGATLTENIPNANTHSVTYTGVFRASVHDNVYGNTYNKDQTIYFTYTNTTTPP